MRPERRALLAACFALFLSFAISTAGEQPEDPTTLIDAPTATVIPHASYDSALRLYSGGGVLFRFRVGVRDAVQMGVSFGGTNVLGSGDPDWNPRVEFQFKGIVLRESYWGPAAALGFDSQGYGFYSGKWDRYQVKSRGFYSVLSKHFVLLGDLGLHAGASYSLERGDDDEGLDVFVGVEKSLGPFLDALVEYDFAANDNEQSGEDDVFGEGEGYLNAALLWRVSGSLHLEADIRNLLRNGQRDEGGGGPGDWSRELQLVYRQYF
jgi:hypothetical protein